MFGGIWKCQNYLYGHFEVGIQHHFFTDTLLSHFKNIMCIDGKIERERARFKASNSQENERKSVILMPHANTVSLLPFSFLEKLAGKLIENGYVVYTNIKDKTEYVIPGTCASSRSVG